MDPAAKAKLEAYLLEWHKSIEEYRVYQKGIHYQIHKEAVSMTYDLYEELNQSGAGSYTRNREKIEGHLMEISKYIF